MAEEKPAKIVYLFGAGATHAELQNIEPDLTDERGLLVSHLSKRVIEKARRDMQYLKDVSTVSGTSGSLNIELLISLIENSKISDWEYKTHRLKQLVREDIEGILSAPTTRRFYLHKALLELHEHPASRRKEMVTGLISLNYDSVLDNAYRQHYGPPRYCFSLDEPLPKNNVPLLKLHGSFNWKDQRIRGIKRTIEIIPLGSTKNYIHPPYGCIWNQALETLVGCDTLRVIGCSLSQNDFHLIDLLFKAHLEKGTAFDIEIIARNKVGEGIRSNYGFFAGLKTLTQIRDNLIPEPEPPNPFRTWLKYKSLALLGAKRVGVTTHIKKVVK
jgi:SIR2-like domain